MTKLQPAWARRPAVVRPRLTTCLRTELEGPLTLHCVAAGFDKISLLMLQALGGVEAVSCPSLAPVDGEPPAR